MNKTILTLAALLSVLCLFAGAPEVTAVTASQQENLVVIDYYLAHPDELLCNVSVEISDDGGLSYGIVPSPGSLSGDIGILEATVQGAPRQIIWDYSQDGIPSGTNYRAKVVADDNIPVIVSPLTHVLTAADLPFIVHMDEMNLVLLNSAPAQYYTPGNILVMAPCPQIPSGLIRKVVSFYFSGNLVYLETVTATLEEAFDQVQLSFSGDLKASDMVSFGPLVDGVTYVPDGKDLSHTFDLSFEMTTDEGVKLAVTGEVKITLGYDMSITVSGPFWDTKLSYLKAGGHGSVNATIGLEIGGELSVDKKVELGVINFAPITVWAGPVPIVLLPSVTLALELEAGVGASVTTSVTDIVTFSAGIKYDEDASAQWSPYGDAANSFSFNPPSLSTSLNASVAAGPQLELKLYGIAGPFIYTPLYVELEADVFATPWWTLKAGFKADAGVEVEVLGVGLEWGVTVFDYPITLALATTDQVAQPSFSPGGANYAAAQNVTISCSTDGASIRYTTDGTTPTTSSLQYVNPFTLTESATVNARGFKDGYNASLTASAAYAIIDVEEYGSGKDASIHAAMPNTNDGTGERLTVRNGVGNPLYPPPAGSWQIDTLIWFSLASVPAGSTIDSATLMLYYCDNKDNNPAGRTLSLFSANLPWNENTLTWNNQPTYPVATSVSSSVPASCPSWMAWDVTADVQDFVAGTTLNYGWKITDITPWNDYNIPITYFRSRDYVNTTERPYLEVQLAGKAEPLIFK